MRGCRTPGYIGEAGGDGNNHNTPKFTERVILPTIQAADLFIPPGRQGLFGDIWRNRDDPKLPVW